MQNHTRISIAILILGVIITFCGAVTLHKGSRAYEELGGTIHRAGMTTLLGGFLVFVIGSNIHRNKARNADRQNLINTRRRKLRQMYERKEQDKRERIRLKEQQVFDAPPLPPDGNVRVPEYMKLLVVVNAALSFGAAGGLLISGSIVMLFLVRVSNSIIGFRFFFVSEIILLIIFLVFALRRIYRRSGKLRQELVWSASLYDKFSVPPHLKPLVVILSVFACGSVGGLIGCAGTILIVFVGTDVYSMLEILLFIASIPPVAGIIIGFIVGMILTASLTRKLRAGSHVPVEQPSNVAE